MTARNVPAQRRTVDRRVVGTPAEVAAQIAILRDSGRLVAMSMPRQMPNGDTRVYANVRFLDRPVPAATPTRQRRRWAVVTYLAAAGVAVLGVATYALIQLVNAVMEALPFILGGLGLLALVAILAGGGRSRTFSGTFTGRMH